MQALIHAIATVQVRIQAHSPVYANSEFQTRYGLIDPILRALEWDVSNPDEVQVDYPAGNGKADYVLMRHGQSLVVIEAKALSSLATNTVQQGIGYRNALGAPYLVCTDGDSWELYDKQVNILTQVKISSTDVCDAAQKLLRLWKPVVYHFPKKIPQICMPISSVSSGAQYQPPSPPPNAISLPQFLTQLTSGLDGLWKIPQGGVGKIVVPSGTPIKQPVYYSNVTNVRSWFVYTHGSAKHLVGYTIRVLKGCGVDPNNVYVL